LDLGGRLTLVPQYTPSSLVLTTVQGGPGSWRFDQSGNASISTNWTGGLPNGVGDVATLGPVITTGQTVTVDTPTTLGGITFNSNFRYTLGGPQTITLNNGTDAALIQASGTDPIGHLLSAPLNLSSNLTIQTSLGTLTLSGGINDPLGKQIIVVGTGTTIISGPQSYGPGTVLQFGSSGSGFAPGGGPAPVPEPSALVLLVIVGLCLLGYASRRARRSKRLLHAG